MPTKTLLSLENLSKRYGTQHALESVSLDINEGEFVTLLGPSGCGKSTMIRLIAGFEVPTGGTITIDGQSMESVAPAKRPIGMVFQSLALFPHMTVFENVAFGLKMRGDPPAEVTAAVNDALDMMNLSGMGDRHIHQISGGQRQRVALARAIIIKPRMLLLDEPLSALDKKIRQHMQIELKNIQRAVGTTFIFVTHDQEEAMVMSDRIVVMNQGRIDQVGNPLEVYNNPKTYFSAKFVGEMNFLECSVTDSANGTVCATLSHLDAAVTVARPTVASGAIDPQRKYLFCIRPEKLQLSAEKTANSVPGTLKRKTHLGPVTQYLVDVGLEEPLLVANINAASGTTEGDSVHVAFPPEAGSLLDRT